MAARSAPMGARSPLMPTVPSPHASWISARRPLAGHREQRRPGRSPVDARPHNFNTPRVVVRLLYVTGVVGDVGARGAARTGGTHRDHAERRPLLNLTAPVRVAVIDVAGPLADLDCGRAGPPPCTGAWILVCQAGRPLGSALLRLIGLSAPFTALGVIYATLVWLDQRVWLLAGFQAYAGILLLAAALLLLPKLGQTAVGWAYLGTQAALAAAVTPFTVRHIRRAEFGRGSNESARSKTASRQRSRSPHRCPAGSDFGHSGCRYLCEHRRDPVDSRVSWPLACAGGSTSHRLRAAGCGCDVLGRQRLWRSPSGPYAHH